MRPGVETTFYSVVGAAAMRRETAIGYRIAAQSHSRADNYGIRLNPRKSDRRTFAPGDAVIVLAEDDGA